jgi:hypothetical protein
MIKRVIAPLVLAALAIVSLPRPAGAQETPSTPELEPPTPPADDLPTLSATAALAREDALNGPTLKALEQTVAQTHITGRLEDVLAALAKTAGFKMAVNWKVLHDAGIEKSAPVDLTTGAWSVRKVIAEILNEAGGDTAALKFIVDDNQLVISTPDDLSSQKYQSIRVYDVSFVFSDGEAGESDLTSLVEALQTTVAPDTWRERGGTVGSIREFNGKLIVNQTNENQRLIARALSQFTSNYLDRTRAYDVRDILQPAAADVKSPEQKTRDAAALLNAIQANCGRGTWRDDGGTACSGAYFDGRLYITAPPGVHEEIDHLLQLMRKK